MNVQCDSFLTRTHGSTDVSMRSAMSDFKHRSYFASGYPVHSAPAALIRAATANARIR